MKFNSQICTTREQSERLLALGLKKEAADMCWLPEIKFDENREPYYTGNYFERPMSCVWDDKLVEHIPAWSLHRLLCLYGLEFTIMEVFNSECETYDELISAIEQAIAEGYFNPEYLNKEE